MKRVQKQKRRRADSHKLSLIMSSSLSGRVTDGRAPTKRRRHSPPPPPHNGVLSFIVRRRGWTNYGNRDRGYPGAPRQITPLLPPPSLTTITIAVDGAFKKINKTVAVAIPRTNGRRCVPLFSRTVSPTPSLLFNGGKTCIPAPVLNGRDVQKRYGIRRDNGRTRRGRNNIEPSLNRPGLIIIIVAPSRGRQETACSRKGFCSVIRFPRCLWFPYFPGRLGERVHHPSVHVGPSARDFYTVFSMYQVFLNNALKSLFSGSSKALLSNAKPPKRNTKRSCWLATPGTDRVTL